MGLVKYQDMESGKLLSSPELFIKQINDVHKSFETDLIRLIITVIRECIIDEKTRGSDPLRALEKMSRLKTNMYPIPEGLNQISRYYQYLLTLFRNQDIQAFLRSCNFPEGYAVGQEEEISEMSKSIFDNIRNATERSLNGELTEEEIDHALKSKDPKQKKQALAQINKSWTERMASSSLGCER